LPGVHGIALDQGSYEYCGIQLVNCRVDRPWQVSVAEEPSMKRIRIIAVTAALAATPALAQEVNLTGRYQCVQNCVAIEPGRFAFVTQNGREINLVNEAGMASRAWVDYPGRIWVDRAQVGAIYSPDGMVIQFDNGTIWQRFVEVPAAVVVAPPRRR
jgi:hypothetical protein